MIDLGRLRLDTCCSRCGGTGVRTVTAAIGLRYRSVSEDCAACAPERAAIARLKRMVEEMALVHELRAPEGASVTVCCPNPEGPPNEAVEVVDDWTGWVEERFTGDTLLDALGAALKARQAVRSRRGEP
jgi:hypothetical protein